MTSSVLKYFDEMGSPHPEHFPLRISQLNRGIFSEAVIMCPQRGHFERGLTMEIPRGIRHIQAVAKLPKHAPITNA